MNATTAGAAAAERASSVNESNPWLGLASFTEETKAFFFGRDDEVAELARRVQRKLLTVLFGQSGLGKTSILSAGLVPRLRGQGYCPIYVRIDYGRDAPEPAEQIKEAVSRTARHAGEWTQVGVAAKGESLWEFLHHRDDVLRDESGTTLIPLLIFDQFEEIFTLAQSDEFGRARAARFVEELADLVENRPPKALEAKLDADESAAAQFDFARSDYRVLIALREDYLAPLEGLKKAMPSISQNRLRLAPMTGNQALAAVLQPGKKLVTEEVAAAIVRFVAGGAELANAEVEPSLLSLICRELNDARIAQGRSEISLDLLAGSHASILSNFYERALADQPATVRRIVEDDLLTASGFRENVAEERLVSRFAAAGALPDTLAVLVNRRLLRIEERLDIRRVELTHDVLCGVVKSSRDQRHEREAREATERQLAEQTVREASARQQLVRARQVATVCTVLAIAALCAAVFALLSGQRARRAEREAQETRATADQARGQAEHLLGYLSDDFVRELESFGRLNVIAEFSQRQIDYFHALPASLKGQETVRNGALAMVHHARAMRTLGKLDIGIDNASEAAKLLEQQRTAGDTAEATTIALASAYSIQATILDNKNDPAGPKAGARAAELLRPLAEAPKASVAARRAYVEVLSRVGYEQGAANLFEESISVERKAMYYAAQLGALDLTNLDMGALYAESASWAVNAMVALGRNDEAKRLGVDTLAVADKVLEQRPGYRLALHAEQIVEGCLSQVAQAELDPAEAVRINDRNMQVSLALLKLDPNNTTSINNLGVANQTYGDALWAQGRLQDAIRYYLKALADYSGAADGGAGFIVIRAYDMSVTAARQANIGDAAGAAATIATGAPFLKRLQQNDPSSQLAARISEAMEKIPAATAAFERDDLQATQRISVEVATQLRSVKAESGLQASQRAISLAIAAHITGRADYLLGDFAEAEKAERAALVARALWGSTAIGDKRELGEMSTWLAMALAREGRTAEAAQTIAPIVALQRNLASRNRGDRWQPLELACALYAQSLTDKETSAALLREAAALIDGLVPTLRSLHDTRQWRERIQQAQRNTADSTAPAAAEWSAG